jgi:hypothetical protein
MANSFPCSTLHLQHVLLNYWTDFHPECSEASISSPPSSGTSTKRRRRLSANEKYPNRVIKAREKCHRHFKTPLYRPITALKVMGRLQAYLNTPHFSLSGMDKVLEILDDNDPVPREWVPQEWLNCGREYKDVPPYVALALSKQYLIPSHFTNLLPSKTTSVMLFVELALPTVEASDSSFFEFCNDNADTLTPDDLKFGGIPSKAAQIALETDLGQSWFNGTRSLRDTRTGTKYPFWILTFFASMLRACEAQQKWMAVILWLVLSDENDTSVDEVLLKEEVCAALYDICWQGEVPGLSSNLEELSIVLGDNWLNTSFINDMANQLSLRIKDDPELRQTTLVTNTIFPEYILNQKWVNGSPKQKAYLDKYVAWFLSGPRHHLLFPLFKPPNHWIACLVNFKEHRIQYGDSLKFSQYKDFFTRLQTWLGLHFGGTEFSVSADLPSARQDDSFSCSIIASNTLAHNALGDPQWSSSMKRISRMKAFLELIQNLYNQVCQLLCTQ